MRARRSASVFSGRRVIVRMSRIPGDSRDQYPSELRARGGIGGHRAGFRAKDRRCRTVRVRAERPGDLHVVGLLECLEGVWRDRSEGDVRLPGLRHRADCDLPPRTLGEDHPAEGPGLRQQPARAARIGPGRSEEQRARPEERAHERHPEQVHLLSHRQRDCRRRGHADMMTLGDVVRRHESIEQGIAAVAGGRTGGAAVAKPFRRHVRPVGGGRQRGSRRQPAAGCTERGPRAPFTGHRPSPLGAASSYSARTICPRQYGRQVPSSIQLTSPRKGMRMPLRTSCCQNRPLQGVSA